MKRLTSALLVTYVWPPTGGVGAQRVLKMAKYLPEHGVTPAVLTASNPSAPLVDSSLLQDVPEGLEVVRARTLEPSYAAKQSFWSDARAGGRPPGWRGRARRGLKAVARQALIPDPQVLWQPGVQRLLLQRLRAKKDDVVFLTAPPFSTFLAAPLVRATGRAAVILDYRDEWLTARTQYEMLSRWGAAVGDTLERGLLRSAHAITVATDAFRDHLLDRFRFLDPARVVTIHNGYDPDDFPPELLASSPPVDRFVITYAGTVFKQNSARGLLAALRRLRASEPELSRLLTVRFIGRIVDTELDAFEGSEEFGVERVGFVDYATVRRCLAESHMTLCILDSMPGAERIYPAKIFELMMVGRPSITIAPPGALTELAHRHRLGPVVAPRDECAIAETLASALRAWRDGRFVPRAEAVDLERFHRRAVAARFADLFHAVARR